LVLASNAPPRLFYARLGLTLQGRARKSNGKVFKLPANSYARLRARGVPGHVLQEEHQSLPAEHLLQVIWQQQRLQRGQLKTLDGRTVRVLHPGFKNHEAGPDFRGAMVQIGAEAPQTGDVEIDVRPSGWHAHGHDRNPAFKQVVLHVIWDGKEPVADGLPVLALRGMLDAPLAELNSWLGRDPLKSLPENLRGQCCAPLRDLPPKSLVELLHEAAQVRWRAKAGQLAARARQAGWEQALWEGMFRALGYKQNVWPMQSLAESRLEWLSLPCPPAACQARLFGISGLLPAELSRNRSGVDGHLRRTWDQWWREREQFSDCMLPRSVWRFNSLRPANHPQRRLALAAHWLAAGDLLPKLEKWFTATVPDAGLVDSLLEVLQVESDEFWSWHWTFRSARLAQPQPMLGAARTSDLAVNVILPWFWIRAVEGKNEALQRVAEHRYFNWPAAGDNSLLRMARQRLLGGAKTGTLKGAAAQQGLLQILRDFCDHSNAICENCQFPELARNWGSC
jgi:hypothetical protein